MQRYKNLQGNSGVRAFVIGADYIKVGFATGETYVYDYRQPGKDDVENMKALALKGRGLSTYISTHVRERYAKKL
ncbi:MAG TPA: hypothetical protein VL547_07860 [Dinghuibacter sp.]|uniref:hypothetical protein n=1 Tax=Dinghuibacter sp. TaxID=2024697 RepID=UPI002C2B0D79|nr:hypothetical protein [Dinghuibacter sp.]HTJ11924.1 hypothetical protein [Dinghuibacter sp.]